MRAARAFAWEFGRGHRIGLAAMAAYMVGFSIVREMIVGPGHPIRLAPPNGLAAFVVVPMTFAGFYFIGVFTFGLSGDLAARESIYPRRLFTLPLTNAALAGWPMLYGCGAMASLWLVAAAVARVVGADIAVPWIWPMLFCAAVIAWMQALTWMPYGVRGVRVVIAVIALAAIDMVVFVAVNLHVADSTLVALLAPQMPIAYLVAWNGIARARRGETPDWTLWRPIQPIQPVQPHPPFAGPARAQFWFEWRSHGWTLPALVALVVPVELLLLFIRGNDTRPIVFLILFTVLITPPFMAAFAAGALSTSTPFTARRPLTSAAIVAAKLRMTIWSTLAAWLLVIVFTVVALLLSGRMPVVVERAHAMMAVTGTLRFIAAMSFLFAAVVASTSKHLVQSLCIGLAGRDWLIKGSVLVALAVLIVAFPLGDAVLTDRPVQSFVWDYLPWILVALVFMKVMAGSWVAIRLYESRTLSDRALVTGAACWFVAVLALYGVLEWFADSPAIPRYFLGAIAILNVPLARVSAAPLALAWSRHR